METTMQSNFSEYMPALNVFGADSANNNNNHPDLRGESQIILPNNNEIDHNQNQNQNQYQYQNQNQNQNRSQYEHRNQYENLYENQNQNQNQNQYQKNISKDRLSKEPDIDPDLLFALQLQDEENEQAQQRTDNYNGTVAEQSRSHAMFSEVLRFPLYN